MNIIHAPQGSSDWLSVRAKHFTASEAPAMMGASKYMTRAELLRQKHTGIAAAVDDSMQRLFDRGHAAEAAARPIVEGFIDDDLSPMTGTLVVDGLPLLASFDGVTQGRDIVWESKLWNESLAEAIRSIDIAPHYYWQLEQQLLVSGAERAYFTTTDGTTERMVGIWYISNPERRAALIAGWKQFAEDLENYQHVEQTVAPTGRAPDSLPALLIEVTGMVTASNLAEFKQHAMTVFGGIKTALVTDSDFADAEKTVKWCKEVEDRLDAAKSHALAQTASIDELFRVIDQIKEESRSKRLALDKLVKSEKEYRKNGLVTDAMRAMTDHVAKLNQRIGGNWMPPMNGLRFADAIKGLKSLDSMRDKVSTALANAKIEANEIADRIEFNAKQITVDGANYNYLVHDFGQVCTKAPEDFAAMMAVRIAAHKEAEAAKIAAAVEAERVRAAAEADKLTAQNQTQYEDPQWKADAATPTPEEKRAAVVEAQDDISTFMASRDFGKEPSKIRAILVEFVKHQAARAMKAAA